MFINDDKPLPDFVDSNDKFIVEEQLWVTENPSNDYLYQQIVYKILRKPTKLIFHIQRIYFTYRLGMHEQLYAALIDILCVLDGKGLALSNRMVKATQSLLTEVEIKALETYFKNQNNILFLNNKYCVCTTGVIDGHTLLIEKKSSVTDGYDPLSLARDYIEYSQLDSALKTLEEAILETPERQDLQFELLEILKQTNDIQAFKKIRNKLAEKQWDESIEWQQLADYFARKSNEK